MKICIRGMLPLLATILFCTSGFAQLDSNQIDSVVKKSMETFNVPGMAVAVIKNGDIISKKGYGVQSIETEKPVDTNTLFGVASNTKAFTSAALAQLVDEGEIDWDTKVRNIIPEFKLYAPFVTEEFTIRDLLTHRSGLGLGAGDLMVFPAQNSTTFDEMLHNLRYLKPTSSFRSKYDYDNLLYIVAGEVISRVSDEDYVDYIKEHFFKPLEMDRAFYDYDKIRKDDNRIDGHVPVDGNLLIAKRTFTDVGHPAAGINASIDAMTKWIRARLNYGKYGKNKQDSLFSKKQAKEMWSPQTIIHGGKGDYNTHFRAYGLAWQLKDVNGYFQASHTGGLNGIVSEITMIPELDLGIIVLTNQESGAAFTAVTNSIKDGYFDITGEDRIKQYNDRRLEQEKHADSVMQRVKGKIKTQLDKDENDFDDAKIVGTYEDPWFGKAAIEKQSDGTLRFKAKKHKDLIGEMHYYKGTTYVVRWDERWLKADAFVNFSLDTEGKGKGFTMEAISPLTDFSYDYQDLHFKRED